MSAEGRMQSRSQYGNPSLGRNRSGSRFGYQTEKQVVGQRPPDEWWSGWPTIGAGSFGAAAGGATMAALLGPPTAGASMFFTPLFAGILGGIGGKVGESFEPGPEDVVEDFPVVDPPQPYEQEGRRRASQNVQSLQAAQAYRKPSLVEQYGVQNVRGFRG